MSEDQERDGQEGGGVSPESPGNQSSIVSVRGAILASNPDRSERRHRKALKAVIDDTLPDRSGQRWNRRRRQWEAEPEPAPPKMKPDELRGMAKAIVEKRDVRDPVTGRLMKGAHLNPTGAGGEKGGRPRLAYREALGVLEPMAIAALRAALNSKHATVRTTAAQDILDRIHGKPTQPIKDVTPVRLIIHRDY